MDEKDIFWKQQLRQNLISNCYLFWHINFASISSFTPAMPMPSDQGHEIRRGNLKLIFLIYESTNPNIKVSGWLY